MTISEMEVYQKKHPNHEVLCGLPIIGYRMHRAKPAEWFRDRLREIKKKFPKNTINVP